MAEPLLRLWLASPLRNAQRSSVWGRVSRPGLCCLTGFVLAILAPLTEAMKGTAMPVILLFLDIGTIICMLINPIVSLMG